MRIVIGEDQRLLREGLEQLIADEGHQVVATAADGPDLVRQGTARRPDLVIADVRMPPLGRDDGLRAALAIRAAAPEVAILVLSHDVEVRYAVELLTVDTGGVGYLLKQRLADIERFFQALERIRAGGSVIDPEVVAVMLGGARRQPLDALTPRQRDVLALMAEGHTDAGIASALVITERAAAQLAAGVLDTLGLPATAGRFRVPAVIGYLNR